MRSEYHCKNQMHSLQNIAYKRMQCFMQPNLLDVQHMNK